MLSRAKSIYAKILLTIILGFVLPMTLVYFWGYNRLEDTVMNKIEELTQHSVGQIEDKIQDLSDRVNQTSVYLSSDMRLNELLSEYDYRIPEGQPFAYHVGQPNFMNKHDYFELSVELQNILINYADNWLGSSVEMGIIGNDGQLFATWPKGNTDYEQLDWVIDKAREEKGAYFTDIHPSFINYGIKGNYYTYVKTIYGIHSVDTELGMLIVTIPLSLLEQAVSGTLNWEGHKTYILNEENEIIYSFSEENIDEMADLLAEEMDATEQNTQNYAGKRFLIREICVEGVKWKVCCAIPYEEVFQEVHELRQSVVGIGVTLFLLFAVITLIQIYRLLAPLRILRDSMKRVEEGDWDIKPLPSVSKDEIGMLTTGFNRLVKELKNMFQREKESERQKGELRFEMLLAQINPHFLFNTLNSIKWMATMIHADNITSTIRSLARILEISMNRQADVISLREELLNLDSYLEIQSVRYGDLFSVEYDLEEGIGNYQTLKLVFQPIVENAIIHNIQEVTPLKIHIEGRVQDGCIVFVIQDNGLGMDSEQMRKLLETQEDSTKNIFRGIGVRNVHQRIQLKYGEEYGIRIESEKGNGTRVQIRFPSVLGNADAEEKYAESINCR